MRYPRDQSALVQATKLVEKLKSTPDDLVCLLTLQKHLLRQILKLESKTVRLKKAQKRLKRAKSSVNQRKNLSKENRREVSQNIKSLIEESYVKLRDYKQLMFIWRTFGDAIAGIYHSTFSLKHLYYDNEYNPKQDAGYITGKRGFLLEYKTLLSGIKSGVPVLLCDLTNVIRHGDICAMAFEEPVLIELKSSKNQNARTSRQREHLIELSKFLATDEAKNFRGGFDTKRVVSKLAEKNYQHEINKSLSIALGNKVNVLQPEPGVAYISFPTPKTEEQLNELTLTLENFVNQSSLLVTLTPTESILPLQSYALTFSADNSYHFIQEDLSIIAILDIAIIKNEYKKIGIDAVALMDGTHSFQLSIDGDDLSKGICRISEQIFLRIACEFLSPSWFTQETAMLLRNMIEEFNDENIEFGNLQEIPNDWLSPEDCLSNKEQK